MKLKLVVNKNIAFACYLWNVLNIERWPWIKRGLMKSVPKELTKRAIGFSAPLMFSFERHPRIDLKNFTRAFESVLSETEQLHDIEWKKERKNIKSNAAIIKNVCDQYGSFIVDSIEETTKIVWTVKEVCIIPSIYSGGTVIGNKIFFGIRNETEDTFIKLLVHELIHVNTQGCFENPSKSLRLPTDSNEITTCLLTNKVIEKLNKKFRLNVQPQLFHSYYAKFIKNYKKALENIGNAGRGYKSLVLTIDKFLKNKKYVSYYQDRAFRKPKAGN
ncbi:MAG: hypothetical protein AABX14_00360 [Candidatus Aenigmatarchaeota archaeon]